jgi:O-antigen/teichoic acid export membrane protein
MNLTNQAIAGIKWTTLATITSTAFQIVQLTILARLLLPADFGLMAMVMVVIGFAQTYADAGISAAIIHHQSTTKQQLSSLYWLNIMAGGLVLIIFWLLIPTIVVFYNEPQLVPLLQTLSIIFLLVPFGKQFELLLQRDLQFNQLAKQEIIVTVISTSVAVLSALLKQGVWSLVWGQLVRDGFKTILLLAVGLRQYRPMFYFRRRDLSGFIGFGLYQMGERSINFLAERSDQLLLGSLLGAQALGFYNFAFNLVVQPITRINPIVTKVAFPVFTRVQQDPKRLQRGYLKMVNLLTTLNAPVLIGLAVVAPWAVPLIFGQKWAASVVLVQILALVVLLRSIANPTGSLLLAKGRADLGFKWNLFLLIISIPAIFIGAKLNEAMGIALALLLLQIIIHLPNYFYLLKPLIGRCAKAYLTAIFRPILIASVMAGGVWVTRFAGWQPWLTLLLQVTVGLTVYSLLLWLIAKEQLAELLQMLLAARSAPILKKLRITP